MKSHIRFSLWGERPCAIYDCVWNVNFFLRCPLCISMGWYEKTPFLNALSSTSWYCRSHVSVIYQDRNMQGSPSMLSRCLSPQLSSYAVNKHWNKNPQEMIGLLLWCTLPAHTHTQHTGCLCVRGSVGLCSSLTHSLLVWWSRPFMKPHLWPLFPPWNASRRGETAAWLSFSPQAALLTMWVSVCRAV